MKNIGKILQNLWDKTFVGVCSIGKDSNLQLAAFLNEEDLPPSCDFGNIFLNSYSVKDLLLVVHLVRDSVLVSLLLTSKQNVAGLFLVFITLHI